MQAGGTNGASRASRRYSGSDNGKPAFGACHYSSDAAGNCLSEDDDDDIQDTEEYVEETAEEVAEEVPEKTPEEDAEKTPEETAPVEKSKGRKKTNPK